MSRRRPGFLGVALVMAIAIAASNVRAGNLLKNGDFGEGLRHWNKQEPTIGEIAAEKRDGRRVLRIDARGVPWGESSLLSAPVSVRPGAAYCLSTDVKRLFGNGYRCTVGVLWRGADKSLIGADNIWSEVLWGTEWRTSAWQAIAPDGAAEAVVKLGLEMGAGEKNAALFSNVRFETAKGLGPSAALDVFLDPPGKDGGSDAVQVWNSGSEPLANASIRLVPPPGVEVDEAGELTLPRLGVGCLEKKTFRLKGSPQDAAKSSLEVTLRATTKSGARFETSVREPLNVTLPTPVVTTTKDLVAPIPPEMKVRLGAYYFPVMLDWGAENAPTGLRSIAGNRPLLGCYDERLPATADWHIVWALRHGITWLAVDWYWNQGEEFINEALDDGLMKSRFFRKMDFCLLWANQEPTATSLRAYDYSAETLRELARTLCARYFNQPNYLKVDGRPVFMIFLPASLVNGNGSASAARDAIAAFQREVRAHGHPGAFLVAINNTPALPPVAEAGFDAVSAYSYLFAGTLPEQCGRQAFPFDRIVPRYKKWAASNEAQAHTQGLPFIPSAWAGWDDLPRFGVKRAAESSFTPGNTPAEIRSLAAMLIDRADPRLRLALVEAWNEWGEGSCFEPGTLEGFAPLAGLRDILSLNGRGPYTVPVPDAASRRALQASPRAVNSSAYAERANRARTWKTGFEMPFDSPRDLSLQPGRGVAYFERGHGRLKIVATGSSPEVLGPAALLLEAASTRDIRLTARITRNARAIFSWITKEDRAWDAAKSLSVPVTGRAKDQKIEFPVAGAPAWKGEIYQFKIALEKGPGEFEIDEIASLPIK